VDGVSLIKSRFFFNNFLAADAIFMIQYFLSVLQPAANRRGGELRILKFKMTWLVAAARVLNDL